MFKFCRNFTKNLAKLVDFNKNSKKIPQFPKISPQQKKTLVCIIVEGSNTWQFNKVAQIYKTLWKALCHIFKNLTCFG
jgi:hypothetical protein